MAKIAMRIEIEIAHLNGAQGEHTGTDDFRLTQEQLAVLRSTGITASELIPFNRGAVSGTDIFYPTFGLAWSVAVEELIRPPPRPLQEKGKITVYAGDLLPETAELTSLPWTLLSGQRPVIVCVDLGMIAGISMQDINWFVDGTNVFIHVHPADFYAALVMQAALGLAGAAESKGLASYEVVATPVTETPSEASVVLAEPKREEALGDSGASVSQVAFLNGANGEHTNKDDVRRRQNNRPKNGQQTRRPRRARRRRQRNTPGSGGLAISHCAAKYARAIADPFNPSVVGACVPVYPSPPSYKVTSHVRAFTVTVGTAGVGGAWFNPCVFSNGYTAIGTSATFAGTDISLPAADPGAAWNKVTFSTLPFSATSTGIEARLISMAARVTYTGTALDLSGMFVSFCEPDHNPVTATSLDSLAVLPYAKVENTKRRMGNLTPIFGVKPTETTYNNRPWPLGNYTGGTGWNAFYEGGFAGFVVTGVPGTTFNVELIEHVEYIGRSAAAGLSVSHTDSRGFEMVQQAGSQLASYLATSARAAWPTMRSLLVEAARDVAAAAMPAPAQLIRLLR